MTDQSDTSKSTSKGCLLYKEIKLKEEEGQEPKALKYRKTKLSEVARATCTRAVTPLTLVVFSSTRRNRRSSCSQRQTFFSVTIALSRKSCFLQNS